LLGLLAVSGLLAQTPQNVLVVVNDNSSLSRSIGEYYALRRSIPSRNVCHVRVSTEEFVPRLQYDQQIVPAIVRCLKTNNLVETILYIVLTSGVPMGIPGTEGMGGDESSVDSELTLLYSDLTRGAHIIPGSLPNPFFGHVNDKFAHPAFPIYLVTRLAAYDFNEVKGMIDRSLEAKNTGKFVIDLSIIGNLEGETWLRNAAKQLPADRLVLDERLEPLYGQKEVIGYAAWGSNDKNRHERFVKFQWLPGAIMTEFVSTNAPALVRRKSPNLDRRLHPRRRHRRFRTRLRALPDHDPSPRYTAARLLQGTQSGGELLSLDSAAELAERGDRRSAVFARQTVNLSAGARPSSTGFFAASS